MRWVGHVACVGERGEMHKGLLWGDMKKRDNLKDLGVDLRIILSGSRSGMEV
jgi:hypothetical protein